MEGKEIMVSYQYLIMRADESRKTVVHILESIRVEIARNLSQLIYI